MKEKQNGQKRETKKDFPFFVGRSVCDWAKLSEHMFLNSGRSVRSITLDRRESCHGRIFFFVI